jgi:hypothetical protein
MHSYSKKINKATNQMNKDLDVINIISDIRELKVQTKSLFTIDQRKLVKKLAEREISCTDTVSSDVTPHSDTLEKSSLSWSRSQKKK